MHGTNPVPLGLMDDPVVAPSEAPRAVLERSPPILMRSQQAGNNAGQPDLQEPRDDSAVDLCRNWLEPFVWIGRSSADLGDNRGPGKAIGTHKLP